ncbi:acyl-CoA dehydrogenase family protein [Microlunatus panaciterrae]|uniref:Acyl-CoA dehydrogenase n=1 Tax=Microlunatus panaciterrae TaxID=400768 RepID=A0ABS2RHI2_9ACTN|nr:hypothetical protein [Microlunatus panaciterrae]MBM7798463.1 hypothetical protein [Microlunatus panaciterrae]
MVTPLDLEFSAEEIRSSGAAMRRCLQQSAERGASIWSGPVSDLAQTLIEFGRADLCLARLVEGHADGIRILQQADHPAQRGIYGVWASKSAGTGTQGTKINEGWRVKGELRFASGVDLIDRALVPMLVRSDPDRDSQLLVDIPADAVSADRTSWRTPAMDASRSFTVQVDLQVADRDTVGTAGFYLDRPGFAVGGLCVAAVWAGGARQLVDVVTTGLRAFSPTSHQLRRIGLMEQAAWQARTAVESALGRLPALDTAAAGRVIAMARTAVVSACETVLDEAPRVVGPGGLSSSPRLSRTLSDLAIYIRQQHVDAELVRLGGYALEAGEILAP